MNRTETRGKVDVSVESRIEHGSRLVDAALLAAKAWISKPTLWCPGIGLGPNDGNRMAFPIPATRVQDPVPPCLTKRKAL